MVLITVSKKTQRVKGLAFHPTRPWILTTLHTGGIHLWDYRMNTLISTFSDGNEGPVRTADFHSSKPLFVTGGDDFNVKVWNYKLKRCEYTLKGHSDYVRTVQFHKSQPWIVSASDDHTIRIWNWQSRQCISVLSGHHHYVMCAAFHPTEDLVVSSSLDFTIRVWDISALKHSSTVVQDDFMGIAQLNPDLFGNNDVMVKFTLEGHERGVNWVSFHPTSDIILSAGDDHTIKLWGYNDERAWELDTINGHGGNISCAIFHPNKDIIISAAEDKTLRFWDSTRFTLIDVHREVQDRFWIVAAHPTQNLIAAGHDSGFLIFKLYRERPPFSTVSSSSQGDSETLYFIKDKYLKKYDFETGSEVSLGGIDKTKRPYSLDFLKQDQYFLITEKPRRSKDKGSWELYKARDSTSGNQECEKIQSGQGSSAVFMGLRKFAVLNGNGQLEIGSVDSKTRTPAPIPDNIGQVSDIFPAGSGRLLLKTDEKVYLYDREKRETISSLPAFGTKFAIWSDDRTRIALIGRHHIFIASNELVPQCTIQESVRIKSGAFDNQGIFIFTTLSHMKYCLPNGDSGTIKTLESPIYIVKINQNAVHYLDREGNAKKMLIDITECKFKLALIQGQASQIKKIIDSSKILGQSIISYLQKKGYPSIAMKFVEDEETKFNLAIECGNIEYARRAASKLNDDKSWRLLGSEALRQGDVVTVEKCYQCTEDNEKLDFLYLITGKIPQLKAQLSKAKKRNDDSEIFNTALYLGDAETRVRVLLKSGQVKLAYTTAVIHGLQNLVDEIKPLLPEGFQVPELKHKPEALFPPKPILKIDNWPQLHTQANIFEENDEEVIDEEAFDVEAWDDMALPVDEEPTSKKLTKPTAEGDDLEDGGWENLEEIGDIADLDLANTSGEKFTIPTEGRDISSYWTENSQHPTDHIAAGSFATAMNTFHKALSIVDFEPLKERFMSIYSGSQSLLSLSSNLPPIVVDLQRNMTQENEKNKNVSLPAVPIFNLDSISERFKENALKLVNSGKFKEAHDELLSILYDLLFVIVQNKKEDKAYRKFLIDCTQYLVATKLEVTRKELGEENPKRSSELIAYFTRCQLNSSHIKLGLMSAMAVAFKNENFLTASTFAKRLLKMSPPEKMIRQANYIIQMSEKTPTNKHDLDYDDRNPFVICGNTLTPIYAGSESIQCSYCRATFLPKFSGTKCTVCHIATVGGNTSESIFNFNTQFRR